MPRKRLEGGGQPKKAGQSKRCGPGVSPRAARSGRLRWDYDQRCRHAKKERAILGKALQDLLDAQPWEEERRREAVQRAIGTLAMVQREFGEAVLELEEQELEQRRKARCAGGHATDVV